MEIVSKGKLPQEREYQTKCRICETVFKFKQGEGKITRDQRDGDFITVNCPLCNNSCHVNLKG